MAEGTVFAGRLRRNARSRVAHGRPLRASHGRVVQAAQGSKAAAAAVPAWSDYKALTARIFELSRANTNVRSFALSIREKVHATRACEAALAAFVDKLQEAPNPTR